MSVTLDRKSTCRQGYSFKLCVDPKGEKKSELLCFKRLGLLFFHQRPNLTPNRCVGIVRQAYRCTLKAPR